MSKVITLENLEVFKQECDKAYASKEEIITATVDCSHKYEITGNTGDEHGLAIDDQQMLIKKIQGHSRRKSLNLLKDKSEYVGTVQFSISKSVLTINGTTNLDTTWFGLPVDFLPTNFVFSTFNTSAVTDCDILFMRSGTPIDHIASVPTNSVKKISNIESISIRLNGNGKVFNNAKIPIMINEGTTALPFQPYDNTLVNSNNTLISTGRNILNLDEFGAKVVEVGGTYDKNTGIASYSAAQINNKVLMERCFAYNTQYTFIFKGKSSKSHLNLRIYYDDGTFDTTSFNKPNELEAVKIVSKVNKTIQKLSGMWYDGQTDLYLNECAVIKGVDMPFEPYKQDIVQAPSLGEFDYYQEGKIVRQTSQIVTLNGSENWKIEEISPSKRFIVGLLNQYGGCLNDNYTINTTNNLGIENQTTGTTWTGTTTGISAEGDNLHLIIEGITTVEQLKEWLKNNNIQMVFRLATPTIEEYAMPSGYAVYNGGLQIQQGDVPYTITKQYNLSQKAQILANIEVDREQAKMIEENNQKFNLIPKFSHVDINLPETSMNGTLTEEEFKILQANDLNYIMFNKEIYMLSDKTHTIDTLTYSHVGYENHKHMLKTISVTVSTRAWVLNTTEIMTGNSGSDIQSLLGVWVLNETINYKVSQTKNLNMTFNSDGVRCVSFRLTSDNRILYEQYPIGGSSKTIEVYNPTNKWNTKTPSYRTIQITDISALNTEEKITLATFLKANAVKAQDFIIINQPSTATNGILTQEQINKLQANDLNYIIFNNEIYSLNDKTHKADTLTYSHVGFENGKHLLKTISITVSTRAWVLNTTSVVDSYEYRMFKINNPSGNISTSIKEIYIYTNKFDTASRFQGFLQNAYDGDMIFAFPCIAITPTDTIINAQFFYDLNIDSSSYFVIFNDKSEYVAHQNLVVVESA